MGSADSARSVPNTKGENRGQKKRIDNQIRKKRNNMEDNFALPGRMNALSFRR